MTRAPPTILLAVAACSLRPYDFDADATATDPAASTGPASTGGAVSTGPVTTTATTGHVADTTGPDPSSSSSTTASFIVELDGGPGGYDCDIIQQDCPEGQKCMPYSGDGDNSWESLACFPIVPDPDGLYEPCQVFESGVSGKDTCDKWLMCWNVDPDTGTGVCFGQCMGTWDNPSCADPQAVCNGGRSALSICLPGCDPLLQGCPLADLCVPNPQDPDSFICVIDGSGDEGQAFDVCEYANACDAGLLCANPALAIECDPMAPGCCIPFCDLSVMPPTCPGKDQQCLPWHEAGQAPPGLENVGVCGLPQ
jgi:hypothetical protein